MLKISAGKIAKKFGLLSQEFGKLTCNYQTVTKQPAYKLIRKTNGQLKTVENQSEHADFDRDLDSLLIFSNTAVLPIEIRRIVTGSLENKSTKKTGSQNILKWAKVSEDKQSELALKRLKERSVPKVGKT